MISVLNEIRKLRKTDNLNINLANQNPYRIVIREEDGSNTAYYFSVPIYNQKTRRIVTPHFKHAPNEYRFSGSTAEITVSDSIRLCTDGACCDICFDGGQFVEQNDVLQNRYCNITGTLNGVVCYHNLSQNNSAKFTLCVEDPFLSVHSNDRSFSLMRSEFQPYITISGIGCIHNEKVTVPVNIHYQRKNDRKYVLDISATEPQAEMIAFEMNICTPKLIQDTTVDSLKANTNNVFGSTAFLGQTQTYGEQWLYSRIDFSLMEELKGRVIERTSLHLPALSANSPQLTAYSVSSRFCSFGSTWETKKEVGWKIGDLTLDQGYHHLDLSHYLIDPHTRVLTPQEGIVLCAHTRSDIFAVISTGDSYFAPQIIEINYR